MKKCPFCAEEIQDEAVKCKHCGSSLDGSHATDKTVENIQAKYGKAKDHHDYGTITALSVLLPFIGIIVGIVYLTKSQPVDKKLGEHAIALSVLFMIIWYFVFSVFGFSLLTI